MIKRIAASNTGIRVNSSLRVVAIPKTQKRKNLPALKGNIPCPCSGIGCWYIIDPLFGNEQRCAFVVS